MTRTTLIHKSLLVAHGHFHCSIPDTHNTFRSKHFGVVYDFEVTTVLEINVCILNADMRDSNGSTPAHLAASEGHLDCLQTLVEFNSDVTLKDREGCTPSDCAFKSGQTGCGRYLVVVETCVELSARLASCRKENEDLRNRLQVRLNLFSLD